MTATNTTHDPAFDPELVDVEMHVVPPTAPVTGVVTANELCLRGKSASFIRHVCIDVGGTPLEGRFRAGQSFGVVPKGVDERGRPPEDQRRVRRRRWHGCERPRSDRRPPGGGHGRPL